MTRFFIAVLLTAAISAPALAQETKTTTTTTQVKTETKTALQGKALAAALAAVMPLDQQVNDFTESMASTLPQDKQAVFKGIMKKNIDIVKLREAAVDALLKTYTEQELRTMYEFYAKPESQAIMRKLSAFGEAMQPTVEVMLTKAVQESQKAGVFPAQ